jgi:hypothetical protein
MVNRLVLGILVALMVSAPLLVAFAQRTGP